MRITDIASGQTIDRPLEGTLRSALARRICAIKGIKGDTPPQNGNATRRNPRRKIH